MIDLSNIQQREPLRATLAQQMAAFEALHGRVETLPIRIGNEPMPGFRITCPEKPRQDRTALPRKPKAERKPRANTLLKRSRIEKLRPLAMSGATIEKMAEESGYSRKYIARLLWERKLQRGPSTKLD